MSTKNEILEEAHRKLKAKLDELIEELKNAGDELERVCEEEKDKEYVMPENVRNKVLRFKEQGNELDDLYNKLNQLNDALSGSISLEKKLEQIDVSSFNERDFINLIKTFISFNYSSIENKIKRASKLTGMDSFKFLKDFSNYCTRVSTAKIFVIKSTNFDSTSIIGDKISVVNTVKNAIGSNEALLNIFIEYVDKLLDGLEKKKAKLSEECDIFVDEESRRFAHEVDDRINAVLEKKNAVVGKIGMISRASYLYSLYTTFQGVDELEELLSIYVSLGIMSQREVDKLTYEKQEKIEEEEEIKEEKPIEIKQEEVKELDSEYFLRKETQNIICFLGEDGNDIYDDLYSNFDNNLRPKVLNELVSLFYNLYANKDPMLPIGSYPIPTENNKKTRTLLKNPFSFVYKRYFTGGKDYRMHAIVRHSSLLEDLGYGSGNIVFFGALGLNKDEAKNVSYSMVGRRAIEKKTSKSGISRLKPNFDYIEHITRGYIPKSLLSENDKNRIKTDFLGTIVIDDKKIDKSIENGEYVYYYLLDDESKNNIYIYLNKYFMKQSNIMFKFIKELEDKKRDSSLD